MVLSFKLGRIVKFAQDHLGNNFHDVLKEFWGPLEPVLDSELDTAIVPLFNEWLIFEYRRRLGATFISEYYLRNPDNLDDDKLEQLKQVIKTEKFGLFEIKDVDPKKGLLKLYSLFEGKAYKVHDESASKKAIVGKVMWGRLAYLNNGYFFCGGDSAVLYMRLNDAVYKRLLKMGKRSSFSIRDVVSLFFKSR